MISLSTSIAARMRMRRAGKWRGGKMAVEALRAHIQAFSSLGPSALKEYEARLRQLVRDVAPEPEPEAEPEQGSGQGPPPEVAAQLAVDRVHGFWSVVANDRHPALALVGDRVSHGLLPSVSDTF